MKLRAEGTSHQLPQDHRAAELKGPLEATRPSALPKQGHPPTAGCPRGFGRSPRWETPPPLSNPQSEQGLPDIQMEPPCVPACALGAS